jgi:hypothetical protein
MASNICFINDRDLHTDFSLAGSAMVGWPGNLGSAPRDLGLLEGPEMSGGLLDPRLIRQRPGRASIRLFFKNLSTMAAALTKLDALRATLSEGEVAVRTTYAPDRYCLAILETQDGEHRVPQRVNGMVIVALSFLVKDGVAFRLQPDGYALSTARTSCPIGTAPSPPDIVLHGNGATLTAPIIRIRNAAGDIVQTMGFTGIGATDYLLIDCLRTTITKAVGSVKTDATSLWNSGDFPLLQPTDGWVEGGIYPTVELTATAGTPVGVINYRRRYR